MVSFTVSLKDNVTILKFWICIEEEIQVNLRNN